MNKNIVLKKAENFAKNLLGHEGSGHDWWHIERVRNNAHLINLTEKADSFIVDLAVLLHDVGDHKVIKKTKDDYSIAENFLKEQKLDIDIIEKVMFIIKHMSFSKTRNNKVENVSKEFHVVQDADRLDAIGAIGIARAFSYGGSVGRLMYDPTKKGLKKNAATLNHFDDKLFFLKDLMNTKTAKRIAKNRHLFMKNYVDCFLGEWNGKK